MFAPDSAGIGTHVIFYTVYSPGCYGNSDTAAIAILVNPLPDASLIIIPGTTTICEGDSIIIYAKPAETHLWSNGDSSSLITVFSTGNYFVSTTDSNGCSAMSDTVAVLVNPLPPVPTISINGTLLSSSSSTGNQWYMDGNLIADAISQTYNAFNNGIYTVMVTDSNGCSSVSDPLPVGINEKGNYPFINIFPNPSVGVFLLEFMDTGSEMEDFEITVFNVLGREVWKLPGKIGRDDMRLFKIDLRGGGKGIYYLWGKSDKRVIIKKIIIE